MNVNVKPGGAPVVKLTKPEVRALVKARRVILTLSTLLWRDEADPLYETGRDLLKIARQYGSDHLTEDGKLKESPRRRAVDEEAQA